MPSTALSEDCSYEAAEQVASLNEKLHRGFANIDGTMRAEHAAALGDSWVATDLWTDAVHAEKLPRIPRSQGTSM